MIDVKKLRESPDEYKQSIERRGGDTALIDTLLDKLTSRNNVLQATQKLQSQLKLDGKPTSEQLAAQQKIKDELKKMNETLEANQKDYEENLAQIPNLLAPNTPDGGEENNRQDKVWGSTEFNFKAKDHIELNELHDLFDFEAGAKVAGSKFYFAKDRLVRLWQALELFAQDIVRAEGFELMTVPHMVNEEIAAGTGYMPRGQEEQNYRDESQKLVMIATSEIPLTGYHKDDILDLAKPKLYAGLSPSYRLEAGAYGKFSKGLYRVHQFEKLEIYIFCKPDESDAYLQRILQIEERICQELELPYRVMRIAAGDMSAPAYEKYDIEYYSPAEQDYRELTSCSNCTDYQARNLNIRYRNVEGKLEFAHTLNGTAAVSSRLPIAILENFQQENGTIKIPTALQKYYGSEIL